VNASIIGQAPSGPEPARAAVPAQDAAVPPACGPAPQAQAAEIGGRDGPDPTRYGDWEKNGRCIDF